MKGIGVSPGISIGRAFIIKSATAVSSDIVLDNDEAKKIEIEKWEELARAYKAYDEIKVKEGFMDFGDLIIKTLKLFRDRPNILAEYQKQFKYLLVDEFQDTNYAQNELTKLLAGHGPEQGRGACPEQPVVSKVEPAKRCLR